MRPASLCFFIRDDEVLLARKKRGHGIGYWNGVGGRQEPGETMEETAIREAREEVGLVPTVLERVAELETSFAGRPELDHPVNVYLVHEWTGEVGESEEMAPRWFAIEKIPYNEMWPGDRRWLPKVLAGERLTATIRSDEQGELIEYVERPLA